MQRRQCACSLSLSLCVCSCFPVQLSEHGLVSVSSVDRGVETAKASHERGRKERISVSVSISKFFFFNSHRQFFSHQNRTISPCLSGYRHSYWISNCSGLVNGAGLSSTLTDVTLMADMVALESVYSQTDETERAPPSSSTSTLAAPSLLFRRRRSLGVE